MVYLLYSHTLNGLGRAKVTVKIRPAFASFPTGHARFDQLTLEKFTWYVDSTVGNLFR